MGGSHPQAMLYVLHGHCVWEASWLVHCPSPSTVEVTAKSFIIICYGLNVSPKVPCVKGLDLKGSALRWWNLQEVGPSGSIRLLRDALEGDCRTFLILFYFPDSDEVNRFALPHVPPSPP
jgi:hypothetical protein